MQLKVKVKESTEPTYIPVEHSEDAVKTLLSFLSSFVRRVGTNEGKKGEKEKKKN